MNSRLLFLFVLLVTTSCHTAASHQALPPKGQGEKAPLVVVQKKIYVGMSQAEVAKSLGSPHIVTKDALGKEAWIYDRAAQEVTYSEDQGEWLILGGVSKETGASRISQKTLTVVIKFQGGVVSNVTSHASQS